MTPRIFISSTVKDLHFLRESMKHVVESLGYQAVLSEHNGVPYLPGETPTNSCFLSIPTCDVAIVLISRRYGDSREPGSGLGITHTEYRVAQEHKIHTYCLIDHEVLVLREVWNTNTAADRIRLAWPELDFPQDTFQFIDEVVANGAYHQYDSSEDACAIVRTQIAYLFKDLLTKARHARDSENKSILQELVLVRKQLESISTAKAPTRAFVTATSLFVEDSYKQLRSLMNPLSGGLEASITDLLQHDSLDAYFQAKQVNVAIDEEPLALGGDQTGMLGFVCASVFVVPRVFDTAMSEPALLARQLWGHFGVKRDGSVTMNREASLFLSGLYKSIRAMSLQTN